MAQKLRWQERFFGRNLIKCDQLSISTNSDFEKQQQTIDILDETDVVGVYFTFANVYDDFVKRLKDLYQRLNEGKKRRLEVVQVVMWANNDVYNSDFENSHRDCLVGLPWFAMPYCEIDLKVSLFQRDCKSKFVCTIQQHTPLVSIYLDHAVNLN